MTDQEMAEAERLKDAILRFIATEPETPGTVSIPALCWVLTSIAEIEEEKGNRGMGYLLECLGRFCK